MYSRLISINAILYLNQVNLLLYHAYAKHSFPALRFWFLSCFFAMFSFRMDLIPPNSLLRNLPSILNISILRYKCVILYACNSQKLNEWWLGFPCMQTTHVILYFLRTLICHILLQSDCIWKLLDVLCMHMRHIVCTLYMWPIYNMYLRLLPAYAIYYCTYHVIVSTKIKN